MRGHHYRGRDSLSHSAPRDVPAKLALKANDVLRRNDMGGWTKAAPELYPHQWSWDSAFIAIGLAHLDTHRAARELETLFAHQWKTGKVPHIVFNEEAPPESYFPGPEHWACAATSPDAPPAPPYTSCLSQPPVHAIGALRIWEAAHRAGYYDDAGVLRDMFQNHLLQLLALTAMEPPASSSADALRDETAKVLSAVRPLEGEAVARETVRGQYRGYREEVGVASGAETATYGATRLFVDNWRWAGVPFYLRSGKALSEKCSEIVVRFKNLPHSMFTGMPEGDAGANVLGLCIQPDEGVHLRFEGKVPGGGNEMRPVDMEFHYASAFGQEDVPDAYERLLLDAMHGDASLFIRSDTIELSWALIDPILASWEDWAVPPLSPYEVGSWGPVEADELLARDGRSWLRACGGHEGTKATNAVAPGRPVPGSSKEAARTGRLA